MRAQSDPFPCAPSPLRVEASAASDIGRERKNNEDRVIIADLATGVAVGQGAEATSSALGGDWMAAVCDGMGGEEGGEVASSMTVDVILRSLLSLEVQLGRCVQRRCPRLGAPRRSPARLAERLRRGSAATGARAQHGTTTGRRSPCSAMARSSSVRSGTRAPTCFAKVPSCSSREIRRSSPSWPSGTQRDPGGGCHRRRSARNIACRCRRARNPAATWQLTRVPICPADVLLLCSDGLHGIVGDDLIRAILVEAASPHAACAALVHAANERGGPDNVSCVVARFRRV